MSDELGYHERMIAELDKLTNWQLARKVSGLRCGSCSNWMTRACTKEHGPTAPVPVVIRHMNMPACKSFDPNARQQTINEYSVMRKLKSGLT